MSRIHDALRKAEREKLGGASPEGMPTLSETVVQSGPPGAALSGGVSRTAGVAVTAVQANESMPLEEKINSLAAASWNPDPKTMLFFGEQDHAAGSEQFRSLRSHLYLIRKEMPLKKLLVSSPLPKEGKTFVACNLAQIMVRQPDRRVLLMDADLRRSDMHLSFGASATPGLSDHLAGEAETFEILQRGPLPNFYFIAGGKPVTNPLELIGNGRLKALLDRLAPAFDWIILDSPPATLVSDAKMVAEHCDGILMVVKAASTPFDVAQKGCLEFRGRRIVGVVLNRAEGPSAYTSLEYYDESKHQHEAVKTAKQ